MWARTWEPRPRRNRPPLSLAVIGSRGLDKGEVEYRGRRDPENRMLPLEGIVAFLQQQLAQ